MTQVHVEVSAFDVFDHDSDDCRDVHVGSDMEIIVTPLNGTLASRRCVAKRVHNKEESSKLLVDLGIPCSCVGLTSICTFRYVYAML